MCYPSYSCCPQIHNLKSDNSFQETCYTWSSWYTLKVDITIILTFARMLGRKNTSPLNSQKAFCSLQVPELISAENHQKDSPPKAPANEVSWWLAPRRKIVHDHELASWTMHQGPKNLGSMMTPLQACTQLHKPFYSPCHVFQNIKYIYMMYTQNLRYI